MDSPFVTAYLISVGFLLMGAGYSLLLARHSAQPLAQWSYGALCLFFALFQMGSALQYSAPDEAAALHAHRWVNLWSLAAVPALTFFFEALASRRPRLRLTATVTVLSLVVAVHNFTSPLGYRFTELQPERLVQLPWGESIRLLSGTPDVLFHVLRLLSLVLMAASLPRLQTGRYQKAAWRMLPWLAMGWMVASAALAMLSDIGVLSVPYVAGFGFLAMSVAFLWMVVQDQGRMQSRRRQRRTAPASAAPAAAAQPPLPTATASIVDNNSIQNSSQTRQDGTVTALDNAKNNSLTYGVSLGWTIFDGMKMFARHDQLKELQKLGDAELKRTILVKIGQVNSTYYDLVQQQQQLSALDTTIVISTQRLTLAQNRFSIGKASKLEVLNAQVDLNSDQVALLRQKELYANTKILMNQHLARDPKTDFRVFDEVTVDSTLVLSNLIDLAQKQNPVLESQIINKRIAELQLKQVRADRYPIVTLTSGYNFNESQSSLGFTTEASSRGLNYGFNATLNIFDGFNQHRNEKVAKLQIENTQIAIEQQNMLINTQLSTAFQTYLTNLELIELEESNETIAKQNLDITLDKFKIGTITTIDFRTAQLNYVNAKVRYSNAQFQAKLSEIALKELAGNINF